MNIVIGLCVYNNSFGLPYVLNNITKMFQLFGLTKLKIIIFYDISHDNSLEILENFITHFPNILEIIPNYATRTLYRTANIAFARNAIAD